MVVSFSSRFPPNSISHFALSFSPRFIKRSDIIFSSLHFKPIGTTFIYTHIHNRHEAHSYFLVLSYFPGSHICTTVQKTQNDLPSLSRHPRPDQHHIYLSFRPFICLICPALSAPPVCPVCPVCPVRSDCLH